MGLIIAALVVTCAATTLVLTLLVLRREMRTVEVDRPHTAAKPLPDWLYGDDGMLPRMDIPGKRPAVRTRRSRDIA